MQCVLGLNVVLKTLKEGDLIGIKPKLIGIKPKQPIPSALNLNRQWLAIATAMLWLISIGGENEVGSCHSYQSEYLEEQIVNTSYSTSTPRRLSCLRRGFLSILVALLWGPNFTRWSFLPFSLDSSFFILLCLNIKNLALKGS